MAEPRHEVAGGLPCEHIVMQLYYLDQLLVNVCRKLFTCEDNLVPALRHLKWVPDSGTGAPINDPHAIRIEHWSTWNPAGAGSFPAVIVRGNDTALIKVGISNRHMSPNSSNPSGEEKYTKAVAGSHRVLCVSRNANESHLIAMSVADHLQAFSRQICRALDLKVLEVASIGSPKRLRELPHTFAAPVNLEYGLFQTWAVTPAAPRLNRIRLQLDTE